MHALLLLASLSAPITVSALPVCSGSYAQRPHDGSIDAWVRCSAPVSGNEALRTARNILRVHGIAQALLVYPIEFGNREDIQWEFSFVPF